MDAAAITPAAYRPIPKGRLAPWLISFSTSLIEVMVAPLELHAQGSVDVVDRSRAGVGAVHQALRRRHVRIHDDPLAVQPTPRVVDRDGEQRAADPIRREEVERDLRAHA